MAAFHPATGMFAVADMAGAAIYPLFSLNMNLFLAENEQDNNHQHGDNGQNTLISLQGVEFGTNKHKSRDFGQPVVLIYLCRLYG
ncbi:MAG: hypothetical protein QM731_02420 [Chitinophagaceae bacterium]